MHKYHTLSKFLHSLGYTRDSTNKALYEGIQVTQWCSILLFSIMVISSMSAAARSKLDIYRKRRNLAVSGEPVGKVGKHSKSPIFVIQKHDARQLHYDFRLEIDGVLVSWAVPKGPSVSPRIKRLAMPTDDHPLEYADFEGIIPQGYGAGTVMVWDKGTYKNLKTDNMQQCLEDGRIEIFLDGKKLHGAFALIRMQTPRKGWLLIKMRDEYANIWQALKKDRDRSALTGRTMRQIAREEDSWKDVQ